MKEALYAAWGECSSLMCQMPTGTGKTHLLVSVVRDFADTWKAPVWIVVHRKELVEQISETLDHYGVPHGRIVSGCPMLQERVQVASVQTLANRLKACRTMGRLPEGMKPPGLIVIDEAHHAPAPTYELLWKHFPASRKLGMTATPCRLNRKGFTTLFDRLLTSWSVSRFIEEGRLSLFDYISVRPGSRELERVAGLTKRGADGDYSVSEMGAVFDCPESIAHHYRTYRQYADGKKGIIYAINRAHGLHICEYYRERGVRIAAIDSRTPADKRAQCIADYRQGKTDVIVNVDIFSEGFDCPDVEFIQLARPTLSLSKYLQQVGRGMRVHPDKVRTVILDEVGLYRQFGLPTAERDWQLLFEGRLAGKGRADMPALREATPADRQAADADMEIVMGYGELLRNAANRKAEVEAFEQNGKYGLHKGDEIILPPTYLHIGAFTGTYAVATLSGKEYGIITTKGTVLPLPKCRKIELLPDKFAYIEETPILRYYLDLKTFQKYDRLPDVFHLQPLEFVRLTDGFYHLRIQSMTIRPIPAFRHADLTFDGDDFFHNGILIRRSEPYKIYWYEKRDREGNLLLSDRRRKVYCYRKGADPVYYGEKIYRYNTCEIIKK